jgi:hypothetical protein
MTNRPAFITEASSTSTMKLDQTILIERSRTVGERRQAAGSSGSGDDKGREKERPPL